MNDEDIDLLHEAPAPGSTEDQPERPPLPPAQTYDPFGSLFDDRWVNDDF